MWGWVVNGQLDTVFNQLYLEPQTRDGSRCDKSAVQNQALANS